MMRKKSQGLDAVRPGHQRQRQAPMITWSRISPIDPSKDKRIKVGFYAVGPSPRRRLHLGHDSRFPWRCRAVESGIGSDKKTALAEIYEVPWKQFEGVPCRASLRAEWILTATGVIWTVLASGHFASLRPPQVQGTTQRARQPPGQHCPEGWTLYSDARVPLFKGVDERVGSADTNYYKLGSISTTRSAWARTFLSPPPTARMHWKALDPATGKFIVMRVPYPMGFFRQEHGWAHR